MVVLVVVSPEVTAFLLEPTRSGKVPQDFFPQRHPRHCERGSLCRLFCVAGAGLVFEAGVLLVASSAGTL